MLLSLSRVRVDSCEICRHHAHCLALLRKELLKSMATNILDIAPNLIHTLGDLASIVLQNRFENDYSEQR